MQVVTHPDDLPLMLRASHVQRLLDLSRQKTYELMHTAGFPVVRFGRSFRVPRDALLTWIAQQASNGEAPNERP